MATYLTAVYQPGQGITAQSTETDLAKAKASAHLAAERLRNARFDFHIYVTDVSTTPPETQLEIFTPGGRVGPPKEGA